MALHSIVAALAFAHPPDEDTAGDVQRFHEIATSAGTPYRDYSVEYAPLELLSIELIATDSVAATHRALVASALALDLVLAGLLSLAWGRRTAVRYLLLALPLLPLAFVRLDLLPVVIATWGLVLAARGGHRLGGAMLAAATFTKVWPAWLVPAMWIRGARRGMVWFALLGCGSLVVWLSFGGVEALAQVGTFRGATGWHSESVIGTVVWFTTGGPLRLEQGTDRVGLVPGWARVALVLVLVILSASIWIRARRWPGSPEGVPALVSITALICLSPLFSLQYMIWLLPWTAIAWAEGGSGRRFVSLSSAAIVLTGVLANLYLWTPFGWLVPVVAVLLLLRNSLCVWLVVRWFLPWKTVTEVRGSDDQVRVERASLPAALPRSLSPGTP